MTMLPSNKRTFHIYSWLILCIVAGVMAILFLSLGQVASADQSLIMPLDDSYIHFQYARQMARGEPYVYNPGDDATSGATSFLYSPILAVGYLLGFSGLSLGYWAVGVGWLCYLLSAWLIYLSIAQFDVHKQSRSRQLIALVLALAFLVSGPMAWAAFSGMETMLMTLATIATLYGVSQNNPRLAIFAASIAALTRPEGAVIALTVPAYFIFITRRLRFVYSIPILAIGVQPFVNFLVTGSVSASGNQAKSHLYNSTIPMSARIENTINSWLHIWEEWLTGTNPVDGHYLPSILFVLVLLSIAVAIVQSVEPYRIRPSLVALVWLVGISLGIASLETAFWHFKRYQLPLMALFFPLAGWFLLQWRARWSGYAAMAFVFVVLVASSWTAPEFARRYGDNVYVVRNQQVEMALWVNENLPSDARIGVHDVGVMRYVGNRATYDLVGLTTEGVAPAWRQGSGTIYDTMASHEYRPGYFAIYHDIQSLPLLEQAGVFGEELARFTVPLPRNTVASATSTQIVSQPTWPADEIPMHTLEWMLPEGATLVETIDFGDLSDEDRINYRRSTSDQIAVGLRLPEGFASFVRNLPIAGCSQEPCRWLDGTRFTNDYQEIEQFASLASRYTQTLMILRVHAANPAIIRDSCFYPLDYAVVPNFSGQWVDIPIDTIGDFCLMDNAEIAFAWLYGMPQLEPYEQSVPADAVIKFDTSETNSAEIFVSAGYYVDNSTAYITTKFWSYNPLFANAKVLIHVYSDINAPPLQQIDTYAGKTLPPANWLDGQPIIDHYELLLQNLPPGTYTLAIGMYDPQTGTRYTVLSNDTETDRLFLGEIEVTQ